MNPHKLASLIRKNLSNVLGWKTREKIVVIESDDWGSIRMSSLNSFNRLEKAGINLRSADAERFNLNDTLATSHDLECLFEVLSGIKDIKGNYAVITPACIVANPDFKKIHESGFKDYFYEPFTETLKHYPGCEHSFDLWKEGIEKKLFVPQIHGREHLNVIVWMKALQNGDKNAILAFNEGIWGFVPEKYPRVDYQAAFLLESPDELNYQRLVINESIELFRSLFGYSPEYFVPPNGCFNNGLNEVLTNNGVKFRSVSRMQNESLGNGNSRKVVHWLGQKDKTGIRYILRNCLFEPNQNGRDWVDSCLNNINIAFNWQKPAIISSHRVNYIGSLNPANRDNGIRQLELLLKGIMKRWPDVCFMTTAELGKLMNKTT